MEVVAKIKLQQKPSNTNVRDYIAGSEFEFKRLAHWLWAQQDIWPGNCQMVGDRAKSKEIGITGNIVQGISSPNRWW